MQRGATHSPKRWLMLVAVFFMQTCLGGLYGWSVFVPVLTGEYDFTGTQSQIVFGLTIACFTISMIFAGRILPRIGARCTALIGGVLFGSGYGLAVYSGGQVWGLITGIGVVSGAAIGFGYVSALKSGMLWFPAHRGLVTGVAVAGFGGGAILLSQVAAFMLQREVPLMTIFSAIAVGYGGVVCLCALLLFAPPHAAHVPVPQPSFRALMRDVRFWLLGLGICSGTFAGLLIVGNLKPFGLAHGVVEPIAVISISVFAVGNALGRLSWGWVFDRIGFRSIPANLLANAIAVTGMFLFHGQSAGYLAFVGVVGFTFGGCFVLYAAEVSRVYGVEGINCVYPLLFLLYGMSALAGPAAGGRVYDWTGGFGPAVAGSVVLLLLSSLVIWSQRGRMILAEAQLADDV
jgi:MFS transporter, OFA family, oxalate/formate antiporter